MKTLSYYEKSIIAACGCGVNDVAEVEDYMRNVLFGGATLDWQTPKQFNSAARTAWKDIQFMRTPEGIKLMAEIEAEMMAG